MPPLYETAPKRLEDFFSTKVHTAEEIMVRAAVVSKTIMNTHPDVVIVPLHGAFYWARIIQALCNLPESSMIFSDISLHDNGKGVVKTDGRIENQDFREKNVLILEDLVSKGRTMNYILTVLMKSSPGSVSVCPMLDKPQRRDPRFKYIDRYILEAGYTIEKNKFLVGFGLCWPGFPQDLRRLNGLFEVAAASKSLLPEDYWTTPSSNTLKRSVVESEQNNILP